MNEHIEIRFYEKLLKTNTPEFLGSSYGKDVHLFLSHPSSSPEGGAIGEEDVPKL